MFHKTAKFLCRTLSLSLNGSPFPISQQSCHATPCEQILRHNLELDLIKGGGRRGHFFTTTIRKELDTIVIGRHTFVGTRQHIFEIPTTPNGGIVGALDGIPEGIRLRINFKRNHIPILPRFTNFRRRPL